MVLGQMLLLLLDLGLEAASGGRGVGSEEDFALIEKLADALEALGCDPIFLEAPGLGTSEVELIRRFSVRFHRAFDPIP